LQMMTDLDEDADWATTDTINEDDHSDNNVIAESSLDRLACGLGGKMVLPHVMSSLPAMLNHTDWKHRFAALMAISAIGEGCHKQMEVILDQVMSGVLNYLRDPNPRVRYAACNAIGQMSTDFAPNFEKKFHEQVRLLNYNIYSHILNTKFFYRWFPDCCYCWKMRLIRVCRRTLALPWSISVRIAPRIF